MNIFTELLNTFKLMRAHARVARYESEWHFWMKAKDEAREKAIEARAKYEAAREALPKLMAGQSVGVPSVTTTPDA